MSFNWSLLVPYKYASQYITLRDLEREMLRDYHPEYVRRFIGWLHYKNGNVGAGGLARTEQPNKPGFAPSLEVSFHWAGQTYNDGVTGACAVDTVFKDGPDPGDAHDGITWREVPIQGTAEAVKWGIHANVGVPGKGESWHIQPVEIDGHASWVKAGRPAPVRGYPIPAEHDPYAETVPPVVTPPPIITPPIIPQEDDMAFIAVVTNAPGSPVAETWLETTGVHMTHIVDGNAANVFVRSGQVKVPLNAAELTGLLKSVITLNDCPPEWVGTGWQALWTAARR